MADHKKDHERTRRRLLRTLAVLGAVVVTAIAFVGALSVRDDDTSPSVGKEPSDSAEMDSDARPITTKATVGKVIGKLGAQQKEQLKADVAAVVDEFFDNAYLGDYPRDTFDAAYASFTGGAKADAERDADLLSNAEIADQIEQATGTKRRVALDVFAVKGKAEGVTARFTLDFDTTGELQRSERVKGYLLLSRESDGWQVFGYDVIRSVIS